MTKVKVGKIKNNHFKSEEIKEQNNNVESEVLDSNKTETEQLFDPEMFTLPSDEEIISFENLDKQENEEEIELLEEEQEIENEPEVEEEQEFEEEVEEMENPKHKINKLKVFRRVFASAILLSGIAMIGVSCNANKDEKDSKKEDTKNKIENNDEKLTVIEPSTTTAKVNSDGKIELTDEKVTTTDNNNLSSSSISEDKIEKEDYEVERIVVSSEDVKTTVNNYYAHLASRIEDDSNKVEIGELYSTVWMANSQYISTEETNEMIEEGLIPSDLTTLKTEADNVMSLIISENASKVAISEAFGTELDQNKLIKIDEMFLDKEDKEVAKYSYDEYIKLISASNNTEVFNIYENTRNFFNNTTQYEFNEIEKEAPHFKHDYPVNFTQTSIGAQYLIKGLMGAKFVVYSAGTGAITQEESNEFQKTINNVEGPISYLIDKYNGICFENEVVKTNVK